MKIFKFLKSIVFYFSTLITLLSINSYAGTCSDDFIEHRKQPIPFISFPMKDPDIGRSLLPNELVHLTDRTGKNYQVRAVDFFNQINSMEYSLNQWGYSLKDPDGSYNLSTLDICSKLLENQEEAIQNGLINDPANKMLTYEEWKKKIEDAYHVYQSAIPSYTDLIRYGDTAKFDDFITTVKAFDVPRPIIKKP
ncbi:hypothetical protein [Silvanigrella aquatica]|uniref:Uncharacterized protein n=1 Tax=Silvanigrella aquatica TaxID=1915309 RepID=A0A1L4CY59_9BACT|nr:hypothetical protein [Silvanigrella aquatica]APJ02892.1 hypothetical protein AXG55_02725 [Silvanigrella aquatica]